MAFASKQQISMRPHESMTLIQAGESTKLRAPTPVGLLLEEDEAIDVLTRYPQVSIFISISGPEKRNLLISDGHVDAITSIVNALMRVPVSDHL